MTAFQFEEMARYFYRCSEFALTEEQRIFLQGLGYNFMRAALEAERAAIALKIDDDLRIEEDLAA